MFKIEKKKTKLTAGAAAVVLVGSGVAFAYWTTGGSGSGSAPTGDAIALVANQTVVLNAMYPGDSPQTLSGNFDNDNDGPVYVQSVTVSIASVTKGGNPADGCSADDYTIVDPVMTVADEVPVGDGVGTWDGATIQFNNSETVNQDGCKNATVNLAYTIA